MKPPCKALKKMNGYHNTDCFVSVATKPKIHPRPIIKPSFTYNMKRILCLLLFGLLLDEEADDSIWLEEDLLVSPVDDRLVWLVFTANWAARYCLTIEKTVRLKSVRFAIKMMAVGKAKRTPNPKRFEIQQNFTP